MNSPKHQSIIDLLAALPLGSRDWRVVDNWEADLCAIGIARKELPGRLVYISTYRKEPGRYDYECEEPEGQSAQDYKTVDQGKDVDYAALLDAMKRHLV